MNSTLIRSADPNDIPTLKRLCQVHMEYERKNPADGPDGADLAGLLFSPESVMECFVAETADGVVGYATCAVQHSTWSGGKYLYLDCLFLQEADRGNGVGRLLMEKVRATAIVRGCDHVEWHTPEFNKPAVQFYQRLGATFRTKESFLWKVPEQKEAGIDHFEPQILPPPPSLSNPYQPRPTRMSEVRECCDWLLKVYQISLDGIEFPLSTVDAAFECIRENVVWPTDVPCRCGFIVLNHGEQAIWALAHLWVQDILRQFIFCAPLAKPSDFQVSPLPGFNACVWELEVTKHERDAWVNHVMSSPQQPDYDAYLSDSLTINPND